MTLDRPAFQAWLDRYMAAWRSNDPAEIGDLFSEHAVYRYRPTDEPVTGRAAIVASWLEDPDDPARWQAHYDVLAIDGEVHVASGETRYLDESGTQDGGFSNIFVCRFDTDGRCTDFTEIFTADRRFQG